MSASFLWIASTYMRSTSSSRIMRWNVVGRPFGYSPWSIFSTFRGSFRISRSHISASSPAHGIVPHMRVGTK